MKKLVYIFSLAIGLLMTGCDLWEHTEPLAPDTWGAVPELLVEVDSAALDAEGNLIKDVLPLRISTKNAAHMAYAVSGAPVDMDFTALLQGQYGNFVTEIDSTNQVYERTLTGFTAGNTYYIYAVAANAAGVQATATKAVGAIDVTAPVITSTPQLTATDHGRRVTLAFNEPIIREAEMGAIEYMVYSLNMETGEAVLAYQGTDVTAVASGANLTVTLPVELDENSYYVATLSFAEGAVTDLFGNKMAAVTSVFDPNLGEVTNGFWWLVEPAPSVDPEAFFNEGTYYFYSVFTEEDKQYEADLAFEMEYVADGFDLSKIFEDVDGITATEWSLSGLLSSIYGPDRAEDAAFPALTYTYTQEGKEYQDITILDYNDKDYMTCIGSLYAGTAEFPAYIAFFKGNQIGGLYWDFIVADENGNPDAPVEDLIGHWGLSGYTPAIFAYGDLAGKGEDGWYAIMSFDYIELSRDAQVQVQGVKRYDTPVKMEFNPVNQVPMNLHKSISLKK